MVRPRSILPGSATGDSLVTVTVSDMLPTLRITLMTAGLAGRERQPLLLEFLEALELGRHAVAAERKERRAIDACVVRHDDAGVAGVDVGDRDADARKRGARLIGDRAFDRAVDGLRLRQRMRGAHADNDCRDTKSLLPETSRSSSVTRTAPSEPMNARTDAVRSPAGLPT